MSKHSWREIWKVALRILGYQVVFGFFGFMFTPALIGSATAIRVPVLGLLILAAGALFFVDGSYRGERDSAMSETLDKLAEKGTYVPSNDELGKRYAWPKGMIGALLGALPVVAMAAVVAITAKPYVYSLQDLPPWMGSYTHRAEIGQALQYMMGDPARAALPDYLRIAVRFLLFPYVGLFGTMGDDMSLLFDRISPLLALILPLASGVGYLFGPRRRRKNVEMIEAAKNTPRKRLKKDRKKQTGPKEKKQLV